VCHLKISWDLLRRFFINFNHELVLLLTKNLGDVFERKKNGQTFKLEATNRFLKNYDI